jgi:di/tricarboxylate transporter
MTVDMWIALIILGGAIVLFVTEWLRVDVVALMVIASLMLTDLLTVPEAFAGFSNSAVLTIAALFIVGGAVLNTGLANMIGKRILKIAGDSEIRLIVVIMLAVAFLSGFMSSTGTVAVLLPAIVSLSRTAKISPSKLLIPLSFGSLLGGAATLIGTPPNIIVADTIRNANLEAGTNYDLFGFFTYTPIGLLMVVAGVGFMAVIGRRILPTHSKTQERETSESAEELVDRYQLFEQIAYLRVERASKIVGKQIRDLHLRNDYNINIVEIIRSMQPREVASFAGQRLVLQSSEQEYIYPTAETSVERDDILIIRGDQQNIRKFAYSSNLSFEEIPQNNIADIVNRRIGIAEVVLAPRSSLIGKTLRETRFRASHNLNVLQINRPNAEADADDGHFENVRLNFGDTLLLQGLWTDIRSLKRHPRDFVVLGQSGPRGRDLYNPIKAGITLVILSIMVVMMITTIVPLATASLLAALAVVLSGCLTMDEAYDAIDWKSIVLIAGMLPMATALENVGLIEEVAFIIRDSLGNAGPLAVVIGLFILTSVLTQVLSNTATTVLLAPIALVTAQEMGVEPYAYLITIAYAASMAFASPVASPTNTLVLSAGQYRFVDFVKIGVPMMILMMIINVIFVPLFFPF